MIKRAIFIFLLIFSLIISSGLAEESLAKDYKRIVSLMPSATEYMFEIGLEDKIVGVTRYCKFPPRAANKPNIGGYVDVNFEALYSLSPDVVVIQTNSDEQIKTINDMGIDVIEVESRSMEGIIASMQNLGSIFNKEKQAKAVTDKIKNAIDTVKEKVKGRALPRVMMTYYRDVGDGTIKNVYIAGNRTYFDELIQIAGGVNAYQGTKIVTSPIITPEGIISMNPDVIVEVMSRNNEGFISKEKALADWVMFKDIDAYKNNKIFIFNKPYANIPGPRIHLAILDLAKFIHPEIDWDN